MTPFRAWILVAIAVAGVSSSGPITAGSVAPVVAIALWRNLAGAGISGIWALFRDRHGLGRLDRKTFGLAVVSGLVLAAHFSSWFASLRMTSVAASTALVSTTPILTVAFDLARRVPVPRAVLIGVAVSMTGVVAITGVDAGRSGRALAGDGLALFAAAAMAVYMLAGTRVMRTTSPAVYTLVAYGACATVLLPAALISGTQLTGFSTRTWLEIVTVTIAAQVLGHTLFNVTLPHVGATPLALAILLEVPGASLLAWAYLGEAPPLAVLPGAVLMLLGLVVVVRSRAGEPNPVRDHAKPPRGDFA
ncbi:DMT family transporter [Kineosporia mesophila]|uniref:DMT family transporter n=1 Tax=Kineosporia mesophila TaxID=566012 RepID=A0ABP6YW09_9ACTN|nr:DMT family transporter [Kineosporia mesophila]